MTITRTDSILERLAPVAVLEGERLVVRDRDAFRRRAVDDLVFDAVFAADVDVRDASRRLIWAASQELGCPSAS
ncbi:MAG: hypothetical protein M3295_04325, partial [Chloroflexota bacterium]|nr:hypothetical protein [Chloroflexota bacterium]